MDLCRAVSQEGLAKGKSCTRPAQDDGYCGKHKRNKIYDDGLAEGKRWCRHFFRGCNSVLKEEEKFRCSICIEKAEAKKIVCKKENCSNEALKGELYCGNHKREKYRLEEKEKNIKYCDIDRGCFNILTTTKSCAKCLEKERDKSKQRYKDRKIISEVALKTNSNNKRTCVKCNKDYEAFKTRYSKDSVYCNNCQEKQAENDLKREERVRNYKEEHFRNVEGFYSTYIREAKERGLGDFELDFDVFSTLVKDHCYYCKSIVEGEINGIDRVNNDRGYMKDNCVSCCWKCNRMKYFYHPLFFIEKCKIIANSETPPKSFYKKWSSYYTRSCNVNYSQYKKTAEEKRNLAFDISKEEWDGIVFKPCYLCKYQSEQGIGIDRIDNTKREYKIENCKPCCGSCNVMKNEQTLSDLFIQCNKIANVWKNDEIFRNIPQINNPLKPNESDNKISEPPLVTEKLVKTEPQLVKELTSELEDRCHWRAEGVYQAIMNDKGNEFYTMNKDHYKENEYLELCALVKNATKEVALNIIRRLLSTLKKRKYRNNKAHNNPKKTWVSL